MAFPARTRRHLFFSLLFAAFPDPGPDWSGWRVARCVYTLQLSPAHCLRGDTGSRRRSCGFRQAIAMLMAVCWIGLAASVAAVCNLWPRLSFFVCFVCFLSFVAAAGDFSGYQSDGMLLEAGFLALFFCAARIAPGLGRAPVRPRAPAFSCCNGSGSASTSNPAWSSCSAAIPSGATSPPWTTTIRTARCPRGSAGTSQHLPHWFHAATVAGTLALELGLVLDALLPAPRAHHLLLHRHALADRRHPHRQLHLPELPRARARLSAARRRVPAPLRSRTISLYRLRPSRRTARPTDARSIAINSPSRPKPTRASRKSRTSRSDLAWR